MKLCSSGGISIIRCNDINHLNEYTIVAIKFGTITPQKSNAALINAIFHDVAAHHDLSSSQCADLLHANMKHCIQLHLLTTACMLNAAIAMGMGQALVVTKAKKMHGMKALAELYTSMHLILPKSM